MSETAEAAFLQGSRFRLLGEPETAWLWHLRACQLSPHEPRYQTALRSLLFFLPNLTDAQRFEPFLAWGRAVEMALEPLRPRVLRADPERPLKVGYLSGDLRLHSLADLLWGLFQHVSAKDFEVVVYAQNPHEDVLTEAFRRGVSLWRSVHALSDSALAEQIQADQIDLLVDLSGHTAGNRLEVFARKPAPIQIGGLGFGWTTGLRRMDYLFSDAGLVPPERAAFYSEKIIPLPNLFNWNPPSEIVNLPLTGLPCLETGQITLGYGNEGFKLNQVLLATWAEILRQLPHARLALKFRGLEDPRQAQYLLARFQALGIGPERLLLSGKTSHAAHVAWYGQVDLALDPFPYNGGVSTLEALWMGVPVISLAGGTRASVSLLNGLQLTELLAESRLDYLTKVLHLAQAPLALLHYRQTLRQTLWDAPICDSRAYVRGIEAAYRHVWRQFCAQKR